MPFCCSKHKTLMPCDCYPKKLMKLESENKDLQERLEESIEIGKKYIEQNKRLRETLEKISNQFGYSDDTFDEFRRLAKEALSSEGKA